MSSAIVGRFKCMCGFESAHVKQSEKCLYHYCPSCGMNGPHARTEAQKANMRKAMRPEGTPTETAKPAEPVGEAMPPTPTPTGTIEPETQPAPKRRGLFS